MEGIGVPEPTPINGYDAPKRSCISKEIQDINVLKSYDITMKFMDQGMLISVGCKSFAFSTREEGLTKLNEYLNDPEKVREQWFEKIGY